MDIVHQHHPPLCLLLSWRQCMATVPQRMTVTHILPFTKGNLHMESTFHLQIWRSNTHYYPLHTPPPHTQCVYYTAAIENTSCTTLIFPISTMVFRHFKILTYTLCFRHYNLGKIVVCTLDQDYWLCHWITRRTNQNPLKTAERCQIISWILNQAVWIFVPVT